MKKAKLFLAGLLSIATISLASCGGGNENGNTDNQTIEFKTCAQIQELAKNAPSEGTAEEYYCKGKVDKINDANKNNITLKDATGSVFCYKVNDGNAITPELSVGDEIQLKGKLKWWDNAAEFYHPALIKHDHVEVPPLTEAECTEMSIADARNAAPGSKVKLTGVVAIKTKTQKFEDNGFYLIDNTGSIFIYGKDVAQKVNKGNKVTVLVERENYLGNDEENAIAKGYQGAIQGKRTVLVKNYEGENEFDTTWIKESSVKEMIETPLSTNITSDIFKVKAFIHKVTGNATNYLIKDIDDKTGSYVYSSNQVGDFEWLKPYEDKFVEMYLSVINVKLSKSDYIYRLQPISVIKTIENRAMSDKQKADYVLNYHLLNQFQECYTSNPNLKLISTFSEDLWNINNAEVAYISNNKEVLSVTDNTLTLLKEGEAELQVLVKVNEETSQKTIKITFASVDLSNMKTVKEAIDATLNSKVRVHGYVAGSATLKEALYICDDTGSIAVLPSDANDLKDIHIGDHVYFEGIRLFETKNAGTKKGQSLIGEAKLLTNKYGDATYTTKSFVNATFDEIKNFDQTVDHTTTIFKLKAKLMLDVHERYTNLVIVDENAKDASKHIILYCSSKEQYSWVNPYIGLESVDLELALCDWNTKGLKGCIISISDGVSKINNTSNFH